MTFDSGRRSLRRRLQPVLGGTSKPFIDIDRPAHPAGTVLVEAPARLSDTIFVGSCFVGAFTYFNHGAEVSNAHLGRYCSIGQRVLIGPGQHRTDYVTTHPIAADPTGLSAGMQESPAYHASVMTAAARARPAAPTTLIGADVWIGAHAIIMQGIEVGLGAVVAAGAVVTHDVEPYAIVAGVPARALRYRFTPELVSALVDSFWWGLDLSVMPERDFSDPEGFLAALRAASPPPLDPPTAQVS